MASAWEDSERRGQFIMRYKLASGRLKTERVKAATRTEARRIANELERREDRKRRGLEPANINPEGDTVATLLRWWLDSYSRVRLADHETNESRAKHWFRHSVAHTRLEDVSTALASKVLREIAEPLSEQSYNHVRGILSRAYSLAISEGRWLGANPMAGVRKRKIPKRAYEWLRAHEVVAVLDALDPHYRPLFATAFYTAMRKGELLALLKSDVDFLSRTITVRRNDRRDQTKGGHADVIPMHSELEPYLREAVAVSPSRWVFPLPNGSMRQGKNFRAQDILRRAMARRGLVEGWEHRCRRKGCGHREPHNDQDLRLCPSCGMKLWPVPLRHKIRFHDLRHTAATLMLQAGVKPEVAQRMLRHRDIRTTLGTYAHLEDRWIREQIELLSLGLQEPRIEPRPQEEQLAAATHVLPTGTEPSPLPSTGSDEPSVSADLPWCAWQDSNLRPSAPEADALSN